MSRSDRAAGLIPFIIMLVLFLAAVGWGYLNFSARDKAEESVNDLTVQVQKLTEEKVDRRDSLREMGDATGWTTAERTGPRTFDVELPYAEETVSVSVTTEKFVDSKKASQDLVQFVTDALRDAKVTFEKTAFTVPQAGGETIDTQPDGSVTVGYLITGEKQPKDFKWNEIAGWVLPGIRLMRQHIEGYGRQLNEMQQAVEEARSSVNEVTTSKDSTITQLRDQMRDVQQTLTNQISELQTDNNRLRNDVRTAEDEAKAAKETAEKQEQGYKNDILALKQEIQRMKVKIDIERAPTADGQVLAASSSTGIAVINRGKKDNLKPGTVFEVYNFAKGGVKKPKGLIKVIDVYETSARCGIIQMGDLIVEGDLIANELYNPSKVLHFYILGRLRKHGASQAKALLENLGNEVDSAVTVETDYLILGEKVNANDPELEETPEYKKAKEMGVRIITERELEAFTKY